MLGGVVLRRVERGVGGWEGEKYEVRTGAILGGLVVLVVGLVVVRVWLGCRERRLREVDLECRFGGGLRGIGCLLEMERDIGGPEMEGRR